jgi:hypothetical protein
MSMEKNQSEFLIQILEAREKIEYVVETLSEQDWDADLLHEIHCDLMSAQSLIAKASSLVENLQRQRNSQISET